MINSLLLSPIALQIDSAKDVLNIREVTIIGVLLFIIILLISALVHLYKRNEKQSEDRLEEQKEFTKEMLIITEKTGETVRQVNELLRLKIG